MAAEALEGRPPPRPVSTSRSRPGLDRRDAARAEDDRRGRRGSSSRSTSASATGTASPANRWSLGCQAPFDQADAMITEALARRRPAERARVEGSSSGAGDASAATTGGSGGVLGWTHPPGLMTGVSTMIPVRRGRWSPHRAELPLRRLRDRRPRRRHRQNNSIWDLPGTAGPPHALFDSWPDGLHRCGPVHPRRDRVQFLVGAGRPHRLRDRRPAGHRAGFVVGAGRRPRRLRHRQSGFLGGIVGGVSPVCWPCGSPAGRCPPGRAA